MDCGRKPQQELFFSWFDIIFKIVTTRDAQSGRGGRQRTVIEGRTGMNVRALAQGGQQNIGTHPVTQNLVRYRNLLELFLCLGTGILIGMPLYRLQSVRFLQRRIICIGFNTKLRAQTREQALAR